MDQFWLYDGNRIHRWLGYYVAAAVVVRIVWGFFGAPYARFTGFVPRATTVAAYLRALVRGEEPRHLGHNPLGALMVLFFLTLLLAICLTGWMQGTDRFFGIDWVERTHELLADALIVALLIHVAGAILASLRHRENLIWAMVTGRKRAL